LFRYSLFSLLLRLHGLRELPGEHSLDGNGFDFVADSFLFEKAIESRTTAVGPFAILLDVHLAVPFLKQCTVYGTLERKRMG
jgi:hypothetical protein